MTLINKSALAVIVVVVLFAAAWQMNVFSPYGLEMNLLPAEEGLNAGVYGLQWPRDGTTWTADTGQEMNEAAGWDVLEFISTDPHNFIVHYQNWAFQGKKSTLIVETGQPWREINPYRSISYWVQKPNEEYVHVVGDIIIYHLDVSILIEPSPGSHVWNDHRAWFAFVTVQWDQAVADPTYMSKVDDDVWCIPISVYVESWSVDGDPGQHAEIFPSYEGRFAQLYDEASMTGTLLDLVDPTTTDINASVTGALYPDSRFSQIAYMPFTLSDFGATLDWTGLYWTYPAVNYKLKIYCLQYGKFVYTKDEYEQWQDREVVTWDPLAGFFKWLGSTFSFLGPYGWLIGLFIILILGAIILYLLFRMGFKFRHDDDS